MARCNKLSHLRLKILEQRRMISTGAIKKYLSYGLFFCSLLLAGCEATDKDLLIGEAKLRIVNASPESNEYSFFINDTLKTGQPLRYKENSGYLTVAGGNNQVYTKMNDVLLKKTSSRLFLDRDKFYTLFLAGQASKDSLIYISTLDKKTFVSDTMATVRFINVSPNTPRLNLVFQKNLVDSVSVISSIPYRTSSEYIKVRPQIYFFRLKKSGESLSLSNLDNYVLEAGKIYTVWSRGLLNGSGDYVLSLGVLND